MRVATFSLGTRRRTRKLGHALGSQLRPGDLVIIEGPLGAGKTFLVRAACRAAGLPESEPVVSPTFSLIRELPTNPPIAHADLYRLGTEGETWELGLHELRSSGHALLVEWGLRFQGALGPDALVLTLAREPRSATLNPSGPRSLALLEQVVATASQLGLLTAPDERP